MAQIQHNTAFSSQYPLIDSSLSSFCSSNPYISRYTLPTLQGSFPFVKSFSVPATYMDEQLSQKRLNLADLGNPVIKKIKRGPESSFSSNLSSKPIGLNTVMPESFISSCRPTITVEDPIFVDTNIDDQAYFGFNQQSQSKLIANNIKVPNQRNGKKLKALDKPIQVQIPSLNRSMSWEIEQEPCNQLQNALLTLRQKMTKVLPDVVEAPSFQIEKSQMSTSRLFEASRNAFLQSLTPLNSSKPIDSLKLSHLPNVRKHEFGVDSEDFFSSNVCEGKDFNVETIVYQKRNSLQKIFSDLGLIVNNKSSNVKRSDIIKIIDSDDEESKATCETTEATESVSTPSCYKASEDKKDIIQEITEESKPFAAYDDNAKNNRNFIRKIAKTQRKIGKAPEKVENCLDEGQSLKEETVEFSRIKRKKQELANQTIDKTIKKIQIFADLGLDIINTPVGSKYQAIIPILQAELKAEPRRCPKIKWNPNSIKKSSLKAYFRKLSEMLQYSINEEKAIKLLIENENDPKKVYARIEGKEKEYVREFIIRPKRRP